MTEISNTKAQFPSSSMIFLVLLKFFTEKMASFVRQVKFIATIVFNYTYQMDSSRTRASVLFSWIITESSTLSGFLRRYINFTFLQLACTGTCKVGKQNIDLTTKLIP